MLKKLIATTLALTAGLTVGTSSAQTASAVSLGEQSSVMSCFYECEPLFGTNQDLWGEITVLVLQNQRTDLAITATALVFDGNENPVAQFSVPLSPNDVDMINVCRTLHAAGAVVPAPRAGAVEVILRAYPGTPQEPEAAGVYGWIKDFVGKFYRTQNEPVFGRIDGVGKTSCRLTPPTVTTVSQVQALINAQTPPVIIPVYVSNTGE